MSDKPVFKTIYTRHMDGDLASIVRIERELKAGSAVRVDSCYKPTPWDLPERIPGIHQKIRDWGIQHMKYIYAEELQEITNEEDGQTYYRLAWRGGVFPHRYRITWDTLEHHHYIEHEYHGLMEAKNLKHARARFDVWWTAKMFAHHPHPRHAFHIVIKRER